MTVNYKHELQLENGTTILYEDGLDGGGFNHLPDFINAVKQFGKEKYNHGLEWCAGYGVIGYYFLTEGIADLMSFNDCYEPALDYCQQTAKLNKVEEKVFTYHSDSLSKISPGHKWDLVLANPPHCFTEDTRKWLLDNGHGDHTARIVCDVDYYAHKEFFNNVRNHLLPGADLFISEVGEFEVILEMAIASGLELAGECPAPMLSIDSNTAAKIFHFREPS